MKSAKANKAGHVAKGDVLEDLGLSREEIVELKVKMDLWRDLVARIKPLALTQKELAARLGVHQPEVSHLLAGRLSKFSVGTLIQFAVRMDLGVVVKTTEPKRKAGVVKSVQAKTGRGYVRC
ncbi:MAG: helix-turn-helix transcriptional regulator [Acidobacteriaceae bacterium]